MSNRQTETIRTLRAEVKRLKYNERSKITYMRLYEEATKNNRALKEELSHLVRRIREFGRSA